MVELTLEGWTAAQREGLAFLLDDAEIPAQWSANAIAVPDESQAQVQRFINFLANTPDDASRPSGTVPAARDWDLDEPRMLFADDLGISDVATPGLRLGGALVDGLVFCVAAAPVMVAGGRTGAWIQFVLVALYLIGMVGLLGRTLGNMAVGTRVVTVHDRGVPGLRAGFIRWLVPQAGFFLVVALSWPDGISVLWSLIVYAPILSGPSYRGLHDRVSGVMVVDDRLTPAKTLAPPTTEPHHPATD